MVATRALWLLASILCAASCNCQVASANEFTNNLPGYVCPDGMGGAWVSSVSFGGCRPSTNYAAAEREVANLNLPENVAKAQASQFVPPPGSVDSARPASRIYRCADRVGHVTYTDEPCLNPTRQQTSTASGKPLPIQHARERSSGTQATADRSLYDQAVAELEQKYPTLDPNSQNFDRTKVEEILRRKKLYVQKSYGEVDAVRAAVGEVMEIGQSTYVAPDQVSTQPRTRSRSNDELLEAGAKGAIYGAVLLAVGAAASIMWWLLRKVGVVFLKASHIAGNASAKDIARSAGSGTAKIAHRASGVIEAFKEGRRDAEKSD